MLNEDYILRIFLEIYKKNNHCLKNGQGLGWKNRSVVKGIEYFFRGPGFNSHNSQCPHGGKQPSVMPV